MIITKEFNGKYEFITIVNGNFEVVLCDLGAAIFSIKLDGKLMSQSFIDKKDFFKSNNYHGKTIGRVCNRLPGNEVEINNKKYNPALVEAKVKELLRDNLRGSRRFVYFLFLLA